MPVKSQNYSRVETVVRQEIREELKKILGKNFSQKSITIDYPPANVSGDYAVPCFLLAKKFKRPPVELAKQLAQKIKPAGLIQHVISQGPYLNFFVSRPEFSRLALTEVFKAGKKFGKNKLGKGKKVMVEFFSPNTNKPLTIGHLRNICLGSSLVNLLKFCGFKVIASTLYNDRGSAIAKTIVGYQKWGKDQTPKSAGQKPDHFVGSFYVKFHEAAKLNPALEIEAKQVLQAWEQGDKKIIELWQKLMGWVISGFKQTIGSLDLPNFDEEYYESEFYQAGKEIIEQGIKKGVFVKDAQGVILAPLQKFGLPDKIVLRPDDTSLYITQDLYLAYLKDKHHLDYSVYVVGSEQEMYFKQLFKILELLGFARAKNYYHLSYAMVRLPQGKIKSREGLVKGTGADELLGYLVELAQLEIKKRNPDLSQKEIDWRAGRIALGALKFYILSVNPKTTMIFDPQKSLALTGRTGPYLQYVSARINSIFSKVKTKPSVKVDFSALGQDLEFGLVKNFSHFPMVIYEAVKNSDPGQLANYLYELAKSFSFFYEQLPVLKTEEKTQKARLLLLADLNIILKTGLEILGIEALEKM
ncbi:MAG: arginine--tRNA ligase [Candidatus Buchananbacteria bacterium RIFCSPHIGHO2_01_FULL_39_14]|uniref:Arginine--tRNA ligase n=2 Tax=Candidatus Buchananiibacteriota TaxID=1817903 RepID=A0A1G1YUD2_9BACT|nr:MAG: arginine--tRNA ligase [Candidatus Buchananbacteria bacterium RIFCSPHIGHO2_01_FULL_39_14]OGY49195.1 MAG: arginine--tRNA ligase [Candidatus Buchananbacteria bacterium RIFCSPHIGHO2_02_FULL_39_17]OGY55879.1 MAG: arginine--tRNA ligase [Candidatus Buchananbacteria bacterium RIFCSPLOWO2_01_FULL_40_23b]